MSEEEARALATRHFGNPTLQKERTREMDLLGWVEALGKNLRYGFRMLARDLGFTTVAVLTLALGIGINTSIFSLISDRLLKPLPYKDADRIVMVHETPLNNPREWSGAAVPNFVAWRDLNRVFEDIGTVNDASLSTNEEEPERLIGLRVQYGYLEALGAKPLLGRLISPTTVYSATAKLLCSATSSGSGATAETRVCSEKSYPPACATLRSSEYCLPISSPSLLAL